MPHGDGKGLASSREGGGGILQFELTRTEHPSTILSVALRFHFPCEIIAYQTKLLYGVFNSATAKEKGVYILEKWKGVEKSSKGVRTAAGQQRKNFVRHYALILTSELGCAENLTSFEPETVENHGAAAAVAAAALRAIVVTIVFDKFYNYLRVKSILLNTKKTTTTTLIN